MRRLFICSPLVEVKARSDFLEVTIGWQLREGVRNAYSVDPTVLPDINLSRSELRSKRGRIQRSNSVVFPH